MTCAELVSEAEADRLAFEEAFRRLGIGGGGGGGQFEVAAELGTGRRPWEGLSDRRRIDEDKAAVVPPDVLSGLSMMEGDSNGNSYSYSERGLTDRGGSRCGKYWTMLLFRCCQFEWDRRTMSRWMIAVFFQTVSKRLRPPSALACPKLEARNDLYQAEMESGVFGALDYFFKPIETETRLRMRWSVHSLMMLEVVGEKRTAIDASDAKIDQGAEW